MAPTNRFCVVAARLHHGRSASASHHRMRFRNKGGRQSDLITARHREHLGVHKLGLEVLFGQTSRALQTICCQSVTMGVRESSLAFFCFVLLVAQVAHCQSKAAPAQFVFGDSLVDQGNNNYILSLARANFRPNGIDLPLSGYQPTGRFSNGRIIPDLISEHLGVPSVLAYLDKDAHGSNLLRGCNFASAGSGILDDTGAIFIQHITMPQQFKDFQKVQAEIVSLVGQAAADELFANALYSLTIGGNDYINNYVNLGSRRAAQFPDYNDYSDLMVSTFKGQLQELYRLGARKMVIANIGPLGCIPSQLSQKSLDGSCVKIMNDYANSFNVRMEPMVFALQKELPGATLLIADSYSIVSSYVRNPQQYGFVTGNTACCGDGRFNGNIPCSIISALCKNREEYLFWDPFHPTDRANVLFSKRLLYGPTSDIRPINVDQLLKL
ncbi:hypothetical protein R1flu_028688 [Riccia fluitans]|uniref:GDSL esterase/lipase n=1 Tax=Riccia fluitans TaxID=41844 RepID=A0ABD1XME2_9MARC